MKCAASTSANGWESAAHGPGGHSACLAFSFFLLFCGNGVGSRTLTGFTCLLVHRQDRPANQWTVGVLTRAVLLHLAWATRVYLYISRAGRIGSRHLDQICVCIEL